MPTTPTYGWPYQSLADPPDGAGLGEDLALAVEATLNDGTDDLNVDGVTANTLYVPGVQVRVATTVVTANSGTITTTETVVMTVVAPVVVGRTYRIRAMYYYQQSVATDTFFPRIKEDNASGNQLAGSRIQAPNTGSAQEGMIEGEYTAASTGNKTFVFTFVRAAGTGNISLTGSAASPDFLYVDYVRG